MAKCGDYGGLNRWGDPCSRTVAEGFTRCNLHGAKHPAAISKAETALALARMPAIEHLYEMLEQYAKDTCPTCNYPKRDSEQARVELQLCKAVLDRTGLPPRVSIEVTKKNEEGIDPEHMLPEERERAHAIFAEWKAIKEAVRQRMMMDPAPTQAVAVQQILEATNAVDGEVMQ